MRIQRLLRTKDLSKVRCSHHALRWIKSVDVLLRWLLTLLQRFYGLVLPKAVVTESAMLGFVSRGQRSAVSGTIVIDSRIILDV